MYFFFLHSTVSLYINVATICEWCEQMLGIPVLCRGLKLPSYPCKEPLPFCERLQGLQLCSSKLVDWPDKFFLFVFKWKWWFWLTLSFSLWDKSKGGSLKYCAAHFCEVVKVSMLDLTRTLWREQSAPLWWSFLPQDEKLKINYEHLKKKKSWFFFYLRPIIKVLK